MSIIYPLLVPPLFIVVDWCAFLAALCLLCCLLDGWLAGCACRALLGCALLAVLCSQCFACCALLAVLCLLCFDCCACLLNGLAYWACLLCLLWLLAVLASLCFAVLCCALLAVLDLLFFACLLACLMCLLRSECINQVLVFIRMHPYASIYVCYASVWHHLTHVSQEKWNILLTNAIHDLEICIDGWR